MSTIDELMFKNSLLLSPKDIDEIVAYQRKARASYESGVKVKKGDPKPKIDLIGLGYIKAQQSSFKKRKF